VDGGRASRLRAHLDSCTACARELSATQHALAALDRAAEAPAVDLWPQFAARLAEERARVPFWHRWLPQFPAAGLGSLLGHPAARPALGLAAALVAVIAYGTLRPSGTQPAGPQVAIAPAAPETPFRAERPTTAPEAERKNLFPEQPSAPRKSRPAVRQVRRVLVARERTPSRGEPRRRRPASPLLASRPAGPAGARPARVPERRVLIAQSSRLEIPEAADLTAVALPASEVNSEQARAEVTPEVVEVVRLLAGVEDAAARPFGAPFPGQ